MISVIIPLYNKQETICRTVNSVLNQSYKDFELLILNDGSTDDSLAIIKNVVDPRIRIIDKKNEGVSATRNRGAHESKYNLLFFLDADDYIFPNCLETLIKLHDDFPRADVWSANYEMKDKKYAKVILSRFIYGSVVNPHKHIFSHDWHFRMGSFLITKKSFLEIGGYSKDITVGEDFYFMDKFCERFTSVYIPKVVMAYEQDNRGLSRGGIHYKKVIEYYFDFTNKNKWQKLTYSKLIFIRIVKAFYRGDWIEAKALIRKHGLWCVFGILSVMIHYIMRFV